MSTTYSMRHNVVNISSDICIENIRRNIYEYNIWKKKKKHNSLFFPSKFTANSLLEQNVHDTYMQIRRLPFRGAIRLRRSKTNSFYPFSQLSFFWDLLYVYVNYWCCVKICTHYPNTKKNAPRNSIRQTTPLGWMQGRVV